MLTQLNPELARVMDELCEGVPGGQTDRQGVCGMSFGHI